MGIGTEEGKTVAIFGDLAPQTTNGFRSYAVPQAEHVGVRTIILSQGIYRVQDNFSFVLTSVRSEILHILIPVRDEEVPQSS